MAVTEIQLIEMLDLADSVPKVYKACREFSAMLGFEHFVYAVRIPTSMTQPYHFSISGFPAEWRKRYDEKGYLRIDPVIAHVFSSLKPLLWDEIDRDNPATQEFFADAACYGLQHGLTIPIYGRGGEVSLFSVARCADLPEKETDRLSLVRQSQWFATHVHEAVRRVILSKEGKPRVRASLTAREKDCLLWAADGKTSWEIARILSISERTVNFHLQNVRDKLNVQGSRNAVAKAIALGELETPAYHSRSREQMPVIHWHSAASGGIPPDTKLN